MKRLKVLCLALLTAFTMTCGVYAADPFARRTDLAAPSVLSESLISVAQGQVLTFSPRDLELRLGLESEALQGITLTNLPAESQGVLVLEGVEVEPYQFVGREEISNLCFVPNETAVAATMTMLPQGHNAVATRLTISILGAPNSAPIVESSSYSVLKNAKLAGYVTARDPDGDSIAIRVTRAPAKGEVSFVGQTFTYQPFHNMTGSDSFQFCAVDRFGNYSAEAVVDLTIENNRSGFSYLDMAGNPSEYAAVKLHENGVYSGIKVGKSWLFQPERQVDRGELLVMLLAANGMDQALSPTVNTRLPNDSTLPMWLKPYVKKAIDEEIWSSTQAFVHTEIPARAEAVVLTDRAAKISDVKDFTLTMADAASIPEWSLHGYKDLAAYRMLDLYDGYAHPGAAVTGSYAADLTWQLWKHHNR